MADGHAMTEVKDKWLNREQIDEVIDNLSAADLIEHMVEGSDARSSVRFAGEAFDAAAKRIGMSNGTAATEHVRVSDFKYLAQRIGEAVNLGSPLSRAPGDSPDSANTGA
jgi:hypothetical protein